MEILFHGIGHYTPEKVIGPSEWKHHDILMAYSGEVSMEAGGSGFQMEKGDVLVIPPHNPFVGHATSETAQIWVVHFKGYQSPYEASRFTEIPKAFVVRGAFREPFYMDCCQRFYNLYQEHDMRAEHPELQALFRVLLVQLEKAAQWASEDQPLRKAYDSLLDWATGKIADGIQVADMARKAGLSEGHFRVRFRKSHGISPSEALRQIRIREARQLLRDSQFSIKEISQLTGYGDVVSFHRAFVRSGQTPAQYRATVRNRV